MGFLEKYLPEHVEFLHIGGDILPLGEWYEYSGLDFVSGFLNCARPLSAFLMHRYSEDPKETKEAADTFHKVLRPHTNFFDLDDDVIMLSRSDSDEYWFFWLDHDVSDCSIGRFVTNDSEREVIELFRVYSGTLQAEFVGSYVKHGEPPIELDVSKIKGLISFRPGSS